MNFNFNSIGKELFNLYVGKDKQRLSFAELENIHNKYLNKFNNFVNEHLHSKNDYVTALNYLLLICYINNINLNNHYDLKLTNEDTNRVH